MSKPDYQRRYGVRMLGALLGLLALVWLTERVVHFRWDMTADRRYTLAPATRETLTKLRAPVHIRAFFTADLPAQFSRLRGQAQDVLADVVAQAQGRVTLEVIDPSADSLLRDEALELGMQEVQVAERTRGGAVAQRGFFGLELRSGDEVEVIALVQNSESLEYELMLCLRRLAGQRQTVGVVEGALEGKHFYMELGYGNPVPQSGFYAGFRSWAVELERSYDVVYLDALAKVPDSVAVVLVAAPRTLGLNTQTMLDQWVDRGGDLLVLAPALQLGFTPEDVTARYTPPATAALLKRFGIVADSQLVLDRRHGAAFFGESPLGVPYPPFPEIRAEGLDHQHPVTAELGSLLMPWTASFDTLHNPEVTQTQVLLATSTEAWRLPAPWDLRPKDPTQGEGWPSAPPSRRILALQRDLRTAGGTSRLIAVANAHFATDFFIRWTTQGDEIGAMENLSFVLNAVDYLAEETSSNSLRQKQIVNRPLDESADRNRYTWMALNLAFAPLLLGIVAAWRWKKRRKRPTNNR